ncbi:prolipoprotein diacylglyceryl transferase [Mizugakiibacter sediminis]|uniref:Phosphatidylglycerol--prolipoprotein diacylglyceryl transferase n=1 Tax=Mizugakiibacter sediminis TaxID=1475481 RepID=A0A0K8QKI7_9GAMM|nr:prolipoprotein diacylglyceryl transferase [Mizugakiibacter sediminis]GAP65002.1 prolipoprotein diacylglyceryl transferase [Mizugakiibacter sediminis]
MTHPFFVDIDPVAFRLGPVAVHWYGLMYLLGFLGAWWLGERRRRAGRLAVGKEAFADLAFYTMMGVIVGGRVGYMLFYVSLDWIWRDPLALFRVWDGGMSFHGGLLGVLAAGLWWSRRQRVRFFDTVDFVAPLVPIGLGLGRLGNFINGELWGHVTDKPWGMIFPHALQLDPRFASMDVAQLKAQYASGALDAYARHPSQLYEFALEGVVMFAVLWLYSRKPRRRYALSGLFALLYGCFRFGVEFVREPDVQLGYLLGTGWLTMGQVLSLPLIAVGLFLLWLSRRQPAPQQA